MRIPMALLLLTASACASTGGSTPMPEQRRTTTAVTYTGPGGAPVNINLESTAILTTRAFHIQATPQEVWQALALAYPDLGIPLAAYDTTQLYLGNPGLSISNARLGRQRISRFLNCGLDPLGASLADRYAVRLNVVSRVRADPGGALLETQVAGDAAQRGVSGSAVNCTSTGALEESIANATRLRLAGAHP
jgi:hypothetical protein